MKYRYLFIIIFSFIQWGAFAQEINGELITIGENMLTVIKFNKEITDCRFGEKKGYASQVRNNDNSVAIKSTDDNPGTTNLVVTEGGRTHNFIIQYQKSVDVNKIKLYYDFSNLKELKKYIAKQSSTIQQPAIALNTNAEPAKKVEEVKVQPKEESKEKEPVAKEEEKLSKSEKKRIEKEAKEKQRKEEEEKAAKQQREKERNEAEEKERLANLQKEQLKRQQEENDRTAKLAADKLEKENAAKAQALKKQQEKEALELKLQEDKEIAASKQREKEAKEKALAEQRETQRLEALAKQQQQKEKQEELKKQIAASKEKERIAREEQLAEQKAAKEKELEAQKLKALAAQKEKEEKALALAAENELKKQKAKEAYELSQKKAQEQRTADSVKKLYTPASLFKRYPTYFFNDPPAGQKLSSDYYLTSEFENNKNYADKLFTSSKQSIGERSEKVNDVEVVLDEIIFGGVNVYYRLRIKNESDADFATGVINVAWYKQASDAGIYLLPTFVQSKSVQKETNPTMVADYPFALIPPHQEAIIVVATRAISGDDDNQFLIEISNRQKNTTLNVSFDGKVYNKAMNGDGKFKE